MRYVSPPLVVPATRLLDERLAGVQRGRLPLDLELDRPLDRPERVHVLDLDPRPERLLAPRPQGDVGLDPHLAALHVGIADAPIERSSSWSSSA